MEGIFPECEGKTLAQYILMSPLLRNKIPLDFDPMSCVTGKWITINFCLHMNLFQTAMYEIPHVFFLFLK